MKKHMVMLVMAALVVGVLLVSTVAFTVNEMTDVTMVKTFGKTVAVYDGKDSPGLHFKMFYPFQSTVRYDKRISQFDDADKETNTRDQKAVIVSTFCAWKVGTSPEDVKTFNKQFGEDTLGANGPRARLQSFLDGAKGQVIAQHPIDDLVNTDPAKMKLAQIEKEIFDAMHDHALKETGIDVVMVGIKRLGLPEKVTEAVIASMNQERQVLIDGSNQTGKSNADAIKSRATNAAEMIMAFARTRAGEIRAEGESAVGKLQEKFNDNPQLATFLRQVDTLRKGLSRLSVIVLDQQNIPGIEMFHKGPVLVAPAAVKPDGHQPATAPSAAERAARSE
jgi:membrane protease subunit HflC